MTLFRHLSLISCNFCIFHRNRIISFMPMKSKFVFTKQIKEMTKICFNTLKIIVVKYGEIWFPWQNMVLCSTTCCYKENITKNAYKCIMHVNNIFYELYKVFYLHRGAAKRQENRFCQHRDCMWNSMVSSTTKCSNKTFRQSMPITSVRRSWPM